ncbi:metal-dependent hydrolase [Brevibacillus thermoruber]|uniref:Metal-dependent hydrolase n=1 Tax=Brevibacillus thermoruber TaxID=33942 RepID=A0A9X3TUB6_9BACL|nr:metal-dependent hydrolase [Brevibacillus thermoruber]MDA5110350.1 metal-dependent hydrolase [Brevibacillus thermoruber]
MDTGSHLLLGVTLAGLAHVNPAVAENPALAQALMIATIVGSHAPDFDTLVRLRGITTYIRYHRGMTHSIPALFVWPAVIAVPLALAYGLTDHAGLLYVWTWMAVVFHVFLDMLNTYGVQCFRPFTRRWVHLDVLAIFEPVLFALHGAAAVWWLAFAGEPGRIFPAVYLISLLYIGLRAWQHGREVRRVRAALRQEGVCHVTPSFHPFRWRFVMETTERFYTGRIEYGTVMLEEIYPKEKSNEIIRATMGIDGVRAFLGFAQRVHVTWKEIQDGYEVTWSDVRFWYDRKLPFGVDVRLDRNLNVVTHRLGWRKKAWDPPFV